MNDPRLHGVYAITDGSGLPELEQKARAALSGGCRILQYREKSSDHRKRLKEAQALKSVCRQFNALLIINDDPALAFAAKADGVHLGRDDGDIAKARELLGDDALIGISCYNDVARAHAARQAGANYVAFGRFFPSRSKPDAVQAELADLAQARREIDLPIAVIGGITAENAEPLIEHGADMIAVIDALFGSTDISAAAKELKRLFPVSKDAD